MQGSSIHSQIWLDGRPPATPRLVVPSDLVRGEVDVAESDILVLVELLDDCVPRGGLLLSSASPFRRNPTDKECLPSVNVLLDGGFEIRFSQLG